MVSQLVAITFIGVLGCVSASGRTATASPTAAAAAADERALHARSTGLQQAESAMDVARSTSFWAPDAVAQPSGGPTIVGRPAVEALYRQLFTSGMIKEFRGTPSHVEMAASGDLAYETGVNRMVLHTPSGDMLDMGKYLLVWKRIDGEWYVAALSATSDAPAPAPLPAK